MSRAASAMHGRLIFNVGARRSGTFWLERIVGAHPEVTGLGRETYLFSHGIAPLAERFHHGTEPPGDLGSTYIDRDSLIDALRGFCDTVFEAMLAPGTRRLAERTPQHAHHTALIREIYPEAPIVHIIRDGRDVARSLLAQPWGPGTVAGAAREWRDAVRAARSGAAGSQHYLEVRYERLYADPAGEIADLYGRLGLPADPAIMEAALAEAALARNLDPSGTAPGPGKWRAAFTSDDVAAFEEVAGALLDELGYERMEALATRRRMRLRPLGRVREPALPRGGAAP